MESERLQMIFGLILLMLVINSMLTWAVLYTIGTGTQSAAGPLVLSGTSARETSFSGPGNSTRSGVIVSYPNQTGSTKTATKAALPVPTADRTGFFIPGTPVASRTAPAPAPATGSRVNESVARNTGPAALSAGSLNGGQAGGPASNTAVPLGDPLLRVPSGGFINAAVAVRDPPLPVRRDPASYVTLEIPEVEPAGTPSYLLHEFARENYTGYVTAFKLTNQHFPKVQPRVSFRLVSPPLLIDYNVSPVFITDVKYIEWKTGHTMHNETIKVHRAYEDAWFKVTVTDRDTGAVVAEDGVGRTDFFDEHRQLVVRKCGNYSLSFDGYDTTVNLTVRVRNDGLGA